MSNQNLPAHPSTDSLFFSLKTNPPKKNLLAAAAAATCCLLSASDESRGSPPPCLICAENLVSGCAMHQLGGGCSSLTDNS